LSVQGLFEERKRERPPAGGDGVVDAYLQLGRIQGDAETAL